MSRIRLGLVSFAHGHQWSYASQANTRPDAQLIGITDRDLDRGKKMAETFKTRFFPNPKDLYAEGLDGVMVCSENVRHVDDVLEAARHRVNVLCEKPLATTLADGRKMIAACHDAGILLGTAFPMRHSTPVIRAKVTLDAGKIGFVLGANCTNHGSMPGGWFPDPKLSGGGATIDHTVHVVDLLRWLLKDEVVEVYAEIGRLLYPKLKSDDSGLLSMRFKKGTIATLDASWSRVKGFPTWGDVTLKLWGETGLINVDAFAQQIEVMGDRHRYEGWGDNADLGLVTDFLEAIRNRRPCAATGEDGLAAAAVAFAAYRSARTKRPVILH